MGWYILIGSLREESSKAEKITSQKSQTLGTRRDCEHRLAEASPASSGEADHKKVSSPRMTPITHPVTLSGLPKSPYMKSGG